MAGNVSIDHCHEARIGEPHSSPLGCVWFVGAPPDGLHIECMASEGGEYVLVSMPVFALFRLWHSGGIVCMVVKHCS